MEIFLVFTVIAMFAPHVSLKGRMETCEVAVVIMDTGQKRRDCLCQRVEVTKRPALTKK